VFSLFENDHITHRVLHVQLVSKIARVIGRCLRLNEDLIEAIALGHDLGHVPYGHDGEAEINKICSENNIGFFCHNAQSVKFLTEIEMKGEGLNLSLQVLDGILAHNGELLLQSCAPMRDKTWETHRREYQGCFAARDFSKTIVPMTLEGCVVRISDVIAYVGRDLEDAIIVNLIQKEDIPSSVVRILGDSNAQIINTLVMDLVKNSYNEDHLSFTEEIYCALQELLEFNMKEIYRNPRIKTESGKVCRMFQYLFEKYLGDLKNENRSSPLWTDFLQDLPDSYQQGTRSARIIVDFISGMTDDYFNNLFKKSVLPASFGYRLETQMV
jgi:dGTPase